MLRPLREHKKVRPVRLMSLSGHLRDEIPFTFTLVAGHTCSDLPPFVGGSLPSFCKETSAAVR